MAYLDLILNLSLLIAISVVSGFIEKRWSRQTLPGLLIQGFLFGGAAVFGMLSPLDLGQGLIFDGRSIMVSLCAFFFGPLATAVSAVMTIACRIWIAGMGMKTGLLVILSSAGIGLLAHYRLKPETNPPSATALYLFGCAVHLAMLALMFTLPGDTGLMVLKHMGLKIILLYPLATILIGKILTDQVETRKTVASLRESRNRLSEAQHIAGMGDFTWNIQTGEATWSEALYDLLGYDPSEKIDYARVNAKIHHPQDLERITGWLNNCIESGSETLTPNEYRLLRKDGETLWVRTVGIIERKNGQPDRIFATIQNITERKQAEERLAESEEKFSRFFFSSPTWLALTRIEDGEILEVNHSFEKVTGFERAEVIGRTSSEIGLWPEIEKRGPLMDVALKNGGFQEKEIIFRTKDGNPLPVLWSAVVLELDGEDCLLSTVMDISELKRSEKEKVMLQKELQQAYKMEAIGTLAGGIAHEFNNVLGIILGNTELALDNVPDWSPAKESLEEIRTASFRARDVVRQILSFARKTMIALKPLEMNAIVKESLKLIRASIPAMIDIRSDIPSEPKMILGDPTEIHQIIINLGTNAAHAMKESAGILDVVLSEVELDNKAAARYRDLSPGDYIKLTVKDSGEGMVPDVLEKAFEPYFTTKEFGAGSGMGLAVVYGIVKKYKGAITINSIVGQGTTVEVLFPKIEKEISAMEEEEREFPTGNESILLIDDEPAIVNMMRRMLERLGYRVTGMTDSVAALAHFRSSPEDFDLVVTDMAMPRISGDNLAVELMKAKKDIPILLCTGHSDVLEERKAREIGIKGFAIKPLDMGKLASAVRLALDGP